MLAQPAQLPWQLTYLRIRRILHQLADELHLAVGVMVFDGIFNSVKVGDWNVHIPLSISLEGLELASCFSLAELFVNDLHVRDVHPGLVH